jgi:hypothetical protein
LFRAIWEGSTDELLLTSTENYGPSLVNPLSVSGSGWISTKTITPSRSIENVTPSTAQSFSFPKPASGNGKSFKKARVHTEDQPYVPLREWTGNGSLKHRNVDDLVLKTVADGMDDWLNSYNSQ